MEGQPVLLMLVEDNLDHAELIMRHLAENRVANRIIHLQDGQTALDYLRREGAYAEPTQAPRPHVILLDLRLPKVDGLEVLRTLKESPNLRDIPVVILTTSHADRDITQAYARHANSYVVKPVDYTKFRAMMDDLGFYWMAWNTLPED